MEEENGKHFQENIEIIVHMQINNDTTILKGVKLGTIMVDTCDVDSHALRRVRDRRYFNSGLFPRLSN